MQIVVDTNMLIAQVKFRVNVIEMLRDLGQPVILSSVINEIKKLAEKQWEARTCLKLIKELKIVKTRKKGDESILEYAQKNKCIVATNDTKLISKLKKSGIRVARMRQKKYIVLI